MNQTIWNVAFILVIGAGTLVNVLYISGFSKPVHANRPTEIAPLLCAVLSLVGWAIFLTIWIMQPDFSMGKMYQFLGW